MIIQVLPRLTKFLSAHAADNFFLTNVARDKHAIHRPIYLLNAGFALCSTGSSGTRMTSKLDRFCHVHETSFLAIKTDQFLVGFEEPSGCAIPSTIIDRTGILVVESASKRRVRTAARTAATPSIGDKKIRSNAVNR